MSACILHELTSAPSRLLASIAMVHGTLSKQPVASLSNVARVVFVDWARL